MLWVGFYKKQSGKPSITYPEALDEALCCGWIDGVRKSIDEVSYTIRVTPRQAKSTWSLVNTTRVAELKRLGRMKASGLKAFQNRDLKRSGIYSFEMPRASSTRFTRKSSKQTSERGNSSRRNRPVISAPRVGG